MPSLRRSPQAGQPQFFRAAEWGAKKESERARYGVRLCVRHELCEAIAGPSPSIPGQTHYEMLCTVLQNDNRKHPSSSTRSGTYLHEPKGSASRSACCLAAVRRNLEQDRRAQRSFLHGGVQERLLSLSLGVRERGDGGEGGRRNVTRRQPNLCALRFVSYTARRRGHTLPCDPKRCASATFARRHSSSTGTCYGQG